MQDDANNIWSTNFCLQSFLERNSSYALSGQVWTFSSLSKVIFRSLLGYSDSWSLCRLEKSTISLYSSLQFEENENGTEAELGNDAQVEAVIEECVNIVEARYLLQHLFNYALEQSVISAKFEAANKVRDLKP